jgi:hypothetical protein
MQCSCPVYCKYCGKRRSRDLVGHYCKTKNCQWQHGYSTCVFIIKRRGIMYGCDCECGCTNAYGVVNVKGSKTKGDTVKLCTECASKGHMGPYKTVELDLPD